MFLTLKDIKKLKFFFSQLVKIMQKQGNYADVLLFKESSLTIARDKEDINIDKDNDFGVKLMLFDGVQFHEASTTGIDKLWLLQKAKEFAEIAPKNKITLNVGTKIINKHFLSKGKILPNNISIKTKAGFVNMLHKKLLSNHKIINARVIYQEAKETKIFVNTYKQLSQEINSCFIAIMPFVMSKEKDIRYHYKGFFCPGYEVTKISNKAIKDIIKMALAIADAEKLKPGKYDCILSPDVSGLLAHESFGHGMESDTLFKDRAKAKEFLGKQIAPVFVSIIDNPAFPSKNGSFYFDDEGNLAKPTYLIENGIVAQPITDIYSSSRLNIAKTANARAESYDHKCYARMSNTYFGEGKTPLPEMRGILKNGLYLHYSSGGMEDPKGWLVQIQGIVGEQVINGKLTGKMFYEIGMTGYLPTILSNIIAVGNKLEIPGSGRCGKGHKEWVRVSEGGPHLLIKGIDLG